MLRFFTAGESHGPALTAIVEGFPAGVPVTAETLREAVRDEDPRAATRFDIEFHMLLAELLENRELRAWLRRWRMSWLARDRWCGRRLLT